jgi:hypothetical protein
MKKKTKKLALYRETVRNLDDAVLTEAQGGTGWTHGGPECAGTCRCLDFQDTFSGDCSIGCPYTSEG